MLSAICFLQSNVSSLYTEGTSKAALFSFIKKTAYDFVSSFEINVFAGRLSFRRRIFLDCVRKDGESTSISFQEYRFCNNNLAFFYQGYLLCRRTIRPESSRVLSKVTLTTKPYLRLSHTNRNQDRSLRAFVTGESLKDVFLIRLFAVGPFVGVSLYLCSYCGQSCLYPQA